VGARELQGESAKRKGVRQGWKEEIKKAGGEFPAFLLWVV
jgi:hypothetical protein